MAQSKTQTPEQAVIVPMQHLAAHLEKLSKSTDDPRKRYRLIAQADAYRRLIAALAEAQRWPDLSEEGIDAMHTVLNAIPDVSRASYGDAEDAQDT